MADQIFLGQYRVVGHIDEGGMSQILLGRSIDNGQEVALKVLHEHLRKDDKVRKHFQREIHVHSQIRHPHVVQYLDSSLDDPQGPVLVMNHLRGSGLHAILGRERRLALQRVGKLVEQLCSALTHIHSLGIIHRDLKPGNIILIHPGTPYESVKLLDFGLATLHSALYLAPEDIAGEKRPIISGTPQYVCPEQAQGQEMDGRGDLYSLGVMLFEMLSGQLPFQQEAVKDLLTAHESLPPPTFGELGAGQGIPPGVEAVVRDCLAKSPSNRPQTAAMLNDRFQAALGRPRSANAGQASIATPPHGQGKSIQPISDRPAPKREMEDPGALTFKVNVTMPETMALVKLKGFVHDLRGEIVESIPGMIRVRLPEKAVPVDTPPSGILRWLSKDRAATVAEPRTLSEMLLYMEKSGQDRPGELSIRLVMRQRGMANHTKSGWQARCEHVFRNLQAYLIMR